MKIISTLLDFSHKIYFYVGKSWKNVYFHSKMAWPPPTNDVISRNHKNWPLLNLTQNAREGWTNSYWKHQVLMFYLLGENSEKPYGVASTPPPLPLPCTSEVKWYNTLLLTLRMTTAQVYETSLSTTILLRKTLQRRSYPNYLCTKSLLVRK